jgi:hypothetical protein
MRTFTEQFQDTKGKPIWYEGRELRPTYRRPVSKGDSFKVRFLHAVDRPLQGVGLKCNGCEVHVGDTVARNIALWTDTAPKEVVVDVIRAKPGAEVALFNQWRDEKYGATMYHLNNAAMEIVPRGDGPVIIRCSDGWGEPNFDDLVFEFVFRAGN